VGQRWHTPPRTRPRFRRHRALLTRCPPQPQAEDSPNTRTNTAASSFFLTPLNYFDSDVSLESRNAVLLKHPKVAGDPFEFDEYGVEQVRLPLLGPDPRSLTHMQAHCIPPAPAPFSYPGLQAVGLDGKPLPSVETEQLRKEAELFHRIQIEKMEL
jgi:primary-amine oxidase